MLSPALETSSITPSVYSVHALTLLSEVSVFVVPDFIRNATIDKTLHVSLILLQTLSVKWTLEVFMLTQGKIIL